MKKIIRLFVNVLAVAMLLVACLGLFGCADDTVEITLNLEIYNVSENKNYEDATLTVTLHGDYAPETVAAIVSYIEEGYYNDAIIYSMDGNKIMFGDLKMDGEGNIVQNAVKPTLAPEFEGGSYYVEDSELKATEGSIGLFRDWFVRNGYKDNTSIDTGRATWFMPTSEITAYDGNFCIFATFDTADETNANTLANLKSAVNDNADTYYVYYTGEYNAELDDESNGLTFNCTEDEPEDGVAFVPSGEQYESYKQHTIYVAKGEGNKCGAKIVSIEIN